MSITAEYQKSMREAAQGVLRDLLADRPKMPVVGLRELVAEYPALASLTLAELLGPTSGARPAKGDRAKPAGSATVVRGGAPSTSASGSRSREKWNTQTDEGRAALDRAVLESLAVFGGVSVSAEAIRARLGATPAQLRSSLNRHIEAGDVSFSGKARGTRYSLEG